MQNDLSKFERQLLRDLNMKYGKRWNYKNLMEWSTSKEVVERNLQPGEKMYECYGIYIAIKERKQ